MVIQVLSDMPQKVINFPINMLHLRSGADLPFLSVLKSYGNFRVLIIARTRSSQNHRTARVDKDQATWSNPLLKHPEQAV